MNLTAYHAKYFAHDLTRRASSGLDRLSMSLFDAAVDLNPHQIEAALFALESPLSKGVLLADEVGLGKTIEAGIVLCQFWAERKRRLLVICPASLRKQWSLELSEKFNLPSRVLDAKTYRDELRLGRAPLNEPGILIVSFNYASALREEIKEISWDLVVIDEAHKLRNAYRPRNKVGQGIRWATEDCRKLLLTATPLQNSLVELYGLSTLIDEHLFGDINAFRARYASAGSSMTDLRQRLATFCKRTLRNQVVEYVRYTERRAITRPFTSSDAEHSLYEAVSAFLQRPNSYALPQRQRHLTALILRKLLASSSLAIAGTLDTLRARLETLRDEQIKDDPEFAERLVESEEIEDDLLDDILADDTDPDSSETDAVPIDRSKLKEEIQLLERLSSQARNIPVDTKTETLLKALDIGFGQMAETGAARKAVIFTESRRTQDYLKSFLESHGYKGEVVVFNGTNTSPEATQIYEAWLAKNRLNGRSSGSRAIDVRAALVEHFRDDATILLATEAAAEGVNLQFCSLVVNYDLPWNPQRIEQRIGRCHRYGQKHDVVVINFLNERNEADRRVLELLGEKFSLFNGVFGASDDVLGSIESGVDFEKRILAIYQECRTSEEIEAAFQKLQEEMDASIRARMDDTRRKLFEHFDEDVHQRLRIRLADAKAQLDRVGQRFWSLTRFILADRAYFDEDALAFDLKVPPSPEISPGRYHLISKSQPEPGHDRSEEPSRFLYRLSHPLGEMVVQSGKSLQGPSAVITFDVTNHAARVHVVEALRGKATEGKDRVFILVGEDFIGEEDGDLVLRFAYRPATLTDWPESEREGKKKPPAQKDLTASAVSSVLAVTDPAFTAWIAELGKPHVTLNGEKPGHSRLEGHLKRYTARNTFDYFIHKDLGGFLRRELDFYVKNEVMHLDDIESETAPRVEQYLSKIKVIRRIAGKVIDFLAQLENFQKKLWLKKKFVIETQYCITLDRIPEEFYSEITANDAQREEWVRLFAIDEIKGDLTTPAYSVPLTAAFIKAFPTLMVDTRLFSESFKDRLLASTHDLASGVGGVLVDSENFQALTLMQAKYRDMIDCIYVDPPYNTDASAIIYKNDYKHSSWLTLIDNRVSASSSLMTKQGIFCMAIDDEELSEARQLLGAHFQKTVGIVAVRSNPQSRKARGTFSPSHEYALFYGKSHESVPGSLELTAKRLARYPKEDEKGRYSWMSFVRTGTNDRRMDRPRLYYPIFVSDDGAMRIPSMTWS